MAGLSSKAASFLARQMIQRRRSLHSWGSGARIFHTVDLHAAGEPARVVVAGMPHVPGSTMYEKRTYIMENLDDVRKLLLQEPRGYPCQNANIILPPSTAAPDAKFGFVVMEQNRIYPAMSGHNCICVATALLETGMVAMETPTTEFQLEAPCGPINITAKCNNGKVEEISIENQAAFVEKLDAVVDVPTLGNVRIDIAYGGMWYCVVDAKDLGLELVPEKGKDIARLGEMIKAAAREQHPVNHPDFDYPGPDILVFRGPAAPGSGAHARNAVVMSNGALDWERPETWTGMIDRSPCGTGTCAVMAVLHSRGELALNQDFIHESIIGTKFVGRLVKQARLRDGRNAVVPTISGRAWITQYCTVLCDPSDPFPQGYTVGDIWA